MLGGQLTYYLLSTQARLAYKQNYELFKIHATLGHLIASLTALAMSQRWPEEATSPISFALVDGLLAFYSAVAYWMMLGRESVLRMNGSNIRGWWFLHHCLGVCMSGLLIVMRKDEMWYGGALPLRVRMILFYIYLCAVQYFQFRYQQSRLYALRALGRIGAMETTNELAQNAIHHRLLFLVPWLLVAYAMQFALATAFARGRGDARLVGVLLVVMGVGNCATTVYTVHNKGKRVTGKRATQSMGVHDRGTRDVGENREARTARVQ